MVRIENLRKLIHRHGGSAALARELGHANAAYLTHMAGPNPSRPITEKAARKIEQKLGLEIGWLDGGSTPAPKKREADSVFTVLEKLTSEFERQKVNITSTRLSKIAKFTCNFTSAEKEDEFICALVGILAE